MKHKSHVFDCDGVLLDSNLVKERAFFQTALCYGTQKAQNLVEYHRVAGATGREARIDHFFKVILGREPHAEEKREFSEKLNQAIYRGYSQDVNLVPGVREYLEKLEDSSLWVVSGVEEAELIEWLKRFDIDHYFDRIIGTHDKTHTLYQAVKSGELCTPAVYYGDTMDDLRAAMNSGLDFVFVYGFSRDPLITAIKDFGAYAEPLVEGAEMSEKRPGTYQLGLPTA